MQTQQALKTLSLSHCGETIRYHDSTPGVDAPVLLAIHGLLGNSFGLASVLDGIPDSLGLRIVSINLPGSGVSPAREGVRYTREHLALIVDEFISETSRSQPVLLLGHSMGATVAADVVANNPDRASGVVLLSPVALGDSRVARLRQSGTGALSAAYRRALSALPVAIAVVVCRSNPFGQISNLLLSRRGLSGLRRIQAESSPREFRNFGVGATIDYLGIAENVSLTEFAGNPEVRTWVIAGDRDPLCNPESLRRFAARHSVAVVSIDGGGHLAHHEDVSLVSAALTECAKTWMSSVGASLR